MQKTNLKDYAFFQYYHKSVIMQDEDKQIH
jgi:hypothetical protein